jgi:hypothetical protein
MRPFAIELLDKGIELGLLLQKVSAGRPSGFRSSASDACAHGGHFVEDDPDESVRC